MESIPASPVNPEEGGQDLATTLAWKLNPQLQIDTSYFFQKEEMFGSNWIAEIQFDLFFRLPPLNLGHAIRWG